MPSPVGHTLMGYAIYQAAGGTETPGRWGRLLLYAVAANAPDLDFLPGLLVNDANRYHHGPTHSIAFSILVGVGVAFLCRWLWRDHLVPAFGIGFSLCASHIVLDYFTIDTGLPYGMPVFWPLGKGNFVSPHSVFPDIERSPSTVWFFPSLFSLHNLRAVCVEALVLAPVVIGVSLLRRRSPAREEPAGMRASTARPDGHDREGDGP